MIDLAFIVDSNFPQLSPQRSIPRDLSLSPTRKIRIPAAVDGVCRISFSQICDDVAVLEMMDV